MKINGFLKDVTGSSRVVKARRNLINNASDQNNYRDPIKELAHELHPEATHVVITKAEDASPTTRTFTFEPTGNDVLPPFQAGQYCSIELDIDDVHTTRPYSISSAPYQARQKDHPFFTLTIRNGRPGQGFASSFLYANAKVGDTFTCHLPFGHFHVEPLRDAKHIVGLAGGSGITPFYSMAQEIAHGTLDVDLTILYGSQNTKDIILEKELTAIEKACPRVRFINVISNEPDYPGEKGFLSADLIQKYSKGDDTYFVCGPLPMYNFVSGELKKLNIPERRIRMEVFGAPRDVTKAIGYHGNSTVAEPYHGKADQKVKLTVVRGIQEDVIEASTAEPIAVALERAGIPNNTRCRSGACGYCRCQLLEGEVFVPEAGDGRRYADKMFGYVHACSTWPLGDAKIKVPIL
ncbi:MAG: flavin reductase family protein [Bulleidia sp.]|nr:flavin reductase family protein [Bulleidia sp.]